MTKHGSLERLVARVPGFGGYLRRERRRADDQLLRGHGEVRLERALRDLADLTARAPREELGEHQELVTRIEKLRAELALADRGYSAFFAAPKLEDGSALDALYAQDERWLDQVEEIAAHVAGPDFSAGKLRGSVRRLALALADRRNALLGLGSP